MLNPQILREYYIVPSCHYGGPVSPKLSTGFLQVSEQTMLASPINTINVKLIQAST
jgi:hypothetical protein